MSKEFNFKIGADPEINLTMQNRKTNAREVLKFLFGKKDSKNIKVRENGYDIKNNGNIGWDGNSTTAEIRPNADGSPQKVVENIGAILTELFKRTKILDISIISDFDPIGGHIHLEIPTTMMIRNEPPLERYNLIHRKIASFYLPLMASENPINTNMRRSLSYGKLNDFRIDSKFRREDGSLGYTYEFRCPTAEWILTPKLALATLSYMAVIYHEIINRPERIRDFSDIIYRNQKQGNFLQSLTILEYKPLIEILSKKVKKYIKNFEMYPYYKNEIDYLLNINKVLKDKQKIGYNAAIGWGMEKGEKIKIEDIMAPEEKILSKIKKKEEKIRRIINVNFNNDVNVEVFANALKDRVSALNWKLKNNYYIFGIRKGINSVIVKNMLNSKEEFFYGGKIIKTAGDLKAINDLFNRMITKFKEKRVVPNNNTSSSYIIDFKTGKPTCQNMDSYVIGLPYNMRIKKDINKFLKVIYRIEKGISPAAPEQTEPDIDDQETGKIFEIMYKKKETKKEKTQNKTEPETTDESPEYIINNITE